MGVFKGSWMPAVGHGIVQVVAEPSMPWMTYLRMARQTGSVKKGRLTHTHTGAIVINVCAYMTSVVKGQVRLYALLPIL